MRYTIYTFIFLIMNSSCDTINKQIPLDGLSIVETEKQCYIGVVGRDTVKIDLKTVGDSIIGSLAYSYFNEFQNYGDIIGKMSGDTLFAVYTVMSNVNQSKREVAFLIKDSVIYEGQGDAKIEEGVLVFDNPSTLIYSTIMKIELTHCKS